MQTINRQIKSIIFLLLLIQQSVFSQELPPVKIYNERHYNAESQNWSIDQCNNGYIYVANNKGLLEFNGGEWVLYETPNETIMRSVKIVDKLIFTGFYMDFGYWKKDDYGKLHFTSLAKEAKVKMLEDEQIWEIGNLGEYILFKSLNRIYVYNTKSKKIKIISFKNKINKLTQIAKTFFFQVDKKGLYKIENGLPKLVSDSKILKENTVVELFDNQGQILFLTQKKGFFTVKKNIVTPWLIPSIETIKEKTIYSAKKLNNGSFVLGTISDGVISLNNTGGINYQINQDTGLSNNTVLSLFEDKDNNIWLGLDKGINCINNTSPFSIYKDSDKYIGTVYCSILYKNVLYLGTNQGLFYKKQTSKLPFKLINNTQGQVWNLQIIDDTLFCGHDSGTFIVGKDKATRIVDKKGTWKFTQFSKNKILLGCYDGLYILKKSGNSWQLKNKIEGFENSCKFLELTNDSTVFVNHEYKGVFKINLNKEYTKATRVERIASAKKGIHSSIIIYKGRLLYATKDGVFEYYENENRFVKNTSFSKLIDKENFISARMILDKKNNQLWLFSNNSLRFLTTDSFSGTPEISSIPISENLSKGASGYENILYLNKNRYLIGVNNGYLTVDSQRLKKQKNFKVFINTISCSQFNSDKLKLNKHKDTVLANKNNNVYFTFSVPNFNRVVTTKYQYKLEGLHNNWSSFSNQNEVVFDNLPFGEYTFRVRAKINNQNSTNTATYHFKIKRPFLLSNAMIFIYFLGFCLVLYALYFFTSRYYKKQKKIYYEKLNKENKIKELAISQELVKLNNEKLRQDIELKSKELASSTMNIIKKNEFLSIIKSELEQGGTDRISKVIKIIDNNLNNTNDWNLFQEAFNNADKDFLKKVKEKHPKLTPNDLRLCAYLRLNLSSKEIAPLLNISPRSVEVKRYRLRKKMDLPHESNLTNYILEI